MKKIFILVFLISLMFLGCANIPPEASDLSIELGKNMKSLEKSHIAMIETYFDLKRELVNNFIMEKWFPEYAKEFFELDEVKAEWLKITSNNYDGDLKTGETIEQKRMEFILGAAPALQEELDNMKNTLIEPLNKYEKELKQEVTTTYEESYAINTALTSYLVSSNKVSENRKNYLKNLNVEDKKINDSFNKIDDITEELLRNGTNADEQIEKYLEMIKK